jgi:nitrilase
MQNLKAAVVQTGSLGGDTAATMTNALDLIAECGRKGAGLAVFPEAYIGGYPKGADFGIYVGARTEEGREEFRRYYESAIDVPGAETQALGEAAASAGLYLVIGVIEREGGTLFCTALYFGPDGQLLGRHRKVMPTAAERLCWGFGDGSTLEAVSTPWGPMGAVICWENYMPLLRMTMYEQGVTLYCAPTADDRSTWPATMQHIAIEGRCFVLSACQYLSRRNFPADMRNRLDADEDEIIMRGGSLIVDPLGHILAGPDFDGPGILMADLDMGQISRGKFDFDVAGHYARPDIFTLEVDNRPRPVVRRICERARS